MSPRTKLIRVGVKTTEADYQAKLRNVKKILSKGYRVKVHMVFRGQEPLLEQTCRDIFNRLIGDLKNEARQLSPVTLQGKVMSVLFEAKVRLRI